MSQASEFADREEFTLRLLEASALGGGERAQVLALFEENYREANVAYLEKSLAKLKYVALAVDGEGRPAGFALGETRRLDLPRLGRQAVRLAGLCCVTARHRRKRLFGTLENLALSEGHPAPGERVLGAGRMAHPASFRGMARNPTCVPRPGRAPSAWQQEVGAAVAAAYGSDFDPATFVCRGPGVPIGWPVIEVEATPAEWAAFEKVDRSRGDSLLGIAWTPGAPAGWDG